jgi:hypothetical protein
MKFIADDRDYLISSALRCLAQRWKMWHTLYDADLHGRNQLKYGSWVLQLVAKAETAAKN